MQVSAFVVMPRVTLRHDFCGRAWRHARPGHVPPPADPRLAARGRLPAADRRRRRAARRPRGPGRPQPAVGLAAVGRPAAGPRAPVRPARDGSPVTRPRRAGRPVLRPRLAPADGGRHHRHVPRAGAVHVSGCRRDGAGSPPDRRRRRSARRRSTSPWSPATPPTTASSTNCAATSACSTAARSCRTRATRIATRASPALTVEDERYWHPDGGPADLPRTRYGFPDAPGVLTAARHPFRAAGLGAALVRGARQPRQHDAGHGRPEAWLPTSPSAA